VSRFVLSAILGAALIGISELKVKALPPKVAITNFVPSTATLSWQPISTNWLYTVEETPAMTSSQWSPVPGTAWPIATNRWHGTPAPLSESHFYRINATPVEGHRGRIVSVAVHDQLQALAIQLLFSIAEVPATATFDVTQYSVLYETIDPYGAPILASGSIFIPSGDTNAIPVVSYAHGTTLQKDDVPSKLSDERYIGVAFATAGYAAALPDYLGLGDSPGFHPYHHAQSEATATIDLLRATRSYCASNNIPLSDKLFLTGYSQGGHACLATLRELEVGYTNEFHVAACAAGAGAYDLSGTTLTDFLSSRPQPDPYSFVYLLAAYQDIYGLTNSFASMLSLPYSTNLPPLLNGLHDGSEVNALLPSIPKQILQPAFLNDLTHNTNNLLRVALGKNDLIRWTPQSRLRLYRCSGDTEVPIANSQVAYDSFVSRGALHVELKDPSPGASHVDCAIPTAIDALKWFDSLRK
jgi:hypothetical protein